MTNDEWKRRPGEAELPQGLPQFPPRPKPNNYTPATWPVKEPRMSNPTHIIFDTETEVFRGTFSECAEHLADEMIHDDSSEIHLVRICPKGLKWATVEEVDRTALLLDLTYNKRRDYNMMLIAKTPTTAKQPTVDDFIIFEDEQ